MAAAELLLEPVAEVLDELLADAAAAAGADDSLGAAGTELPPLRESVR